MKFLVERGVILTGVVAVRRATLVESLPVFSTFTFIVAGSLAIINRFATFHASCVVFCLPFSSAPALTTPFLLFLGNLLHLSLALPRPSARTHLWWSPQQHNTGSFFFTSSIVVARVEQPLARFPLTIYRLFSCSHLLC